MNQDKFILKGIVPPLVTPLKNCDELDQPGLQRLVEHVIAGGVNGVFILGSTGEAPSLSYRLREELIQQVCRLVDRRVPVLVGVTDTAFIESIKLANIAAREGASAVVLSTPYYFPAGQTELMGYVDHLVKEIPLPLILYNMPSLTKVWFEIETLEKLTKHEKIIGLKDSSGDMEYFEKAVRLKKIRPDWSILLGPEALLLDSLRLGGDGGVSGGANVFPKLFVDCYQAYVNGDKLKENTLQNKIEAFQSLYEIGKYASRYIKATKCCLSLLEICDDFMAEPFHSFRKADRERVRRILQTKFPESLSPMLS